MFDLAAATTSLTVPIGEDEVVLPSEGVSRFARRYDGSVYDVGYRLDYQRFNEILADLATKGASDIVVQSEQRMMASIGGEYVPISNRMLQPSEIGEILRHIYNETAEGQLNMGDVLDGSHEPRDLATHEIRRYRYNVTAGRVPGSTGFEISIRTMPPNLVMLEEQDVEEGIVANILPAQGMNLITGATGSGKSTLMAGIFARILTTPAVHCRIVEFADPIEYVYDHLEMPNASIWQSELNTHIRARPGMSVHAEAIRSAMRRFPRVISISEIRESEAVEMAVKAALTGHVLYSTMHVMGVAQVVSQLLQYYPFQARDRAASEVLDVLNLVVTQRLLPRLGGGRVALREFMVFDAEAKQMLRRTPHAEWSTLVRNLMRERRVVGQTMNDAAWKAHKRGFLTSEQYIAVANEERGRI